MSEQENKETQIKEEAPKSSEGAPAAGSSAWKRLLAKKWVFPATYIAAAAIILTLMWVYQGAGTKKLSEQTASLNGSGQTVTDSVQQPDDALAVNAASEQMQWPVKDKNEVQVNMHFYDPDASGEVKQTAVVEDGNTFTPHVGIDMAGQDDQTFDVLAAVSGKVTEVDKNPIVGNLVEITRGDGLVTVYQSLADVAVTKDQEVKQGDVIAQAGRNELEKGEGVHLHFEVRQNGAPVNPEALLDNSAN